MTRRLFRTFAAAAALLTLAAVGPARAHHSFATYDMAREVKLEGVVESFEWTNPHIEIVLRTAEPGGQKAWRIEGASVGLLTRSGWTRTTLKAGQTVTLSVHPVRSGEPSGALVSATLADGRTLSAGGAAPAVAIK